MPYRLPFRTFGEAAAFDLAVEVSCRCGRSAQIDGASDVFRDRQIMGTRFRCTTILPHGAACQAAPDIRIRKRGRDDWTLGDHSRAMRARLADRPLEAGPATFAATVRRGEVMFLECLDCLPPYGIPMVQLDEPPWDRFLAKLRARFTCPGCGRPMGWAFHYGPGTPATERFREAPIAVSAPGATA